MKKIKAWLSAIAVIAAVSATFATQYPKSSQIQAYEFLAGICQQRDADCVAPNQVACVLDNKTMYEGPTEGVSGCGQALGRP